MKKLFLLSLPILLLFVLGGCSKLLDNANKAPVIISATQPTTSVSDNEVVALAVIASDSDGDPLTYTWTTLEGTLSSPNAAITNWTAPNLNGNHHSVNIILSVSDGKTSTGRSWTFSVNTPVQATGNGGAVVTSNQQYSQPVTVDPTITPATPVSFYANTQMSEIYLQWNPVTTFKNGSPINANLLKYRIYRAQVESGPFDTRNTPFFLHAEVSANRTSFSEVAIGVRYWYKITAVSVSGNESLQSGTVSTVDDPAPGVPVISSFRAYNVGENPAGNNSISISWPNLGVSDLAGYRIYRADASKKNNLPDPFDNHDGQYTLVGETGLSSFTDDSLTVTGNYFYRVSSYDFSGNESIMSQYGAVNNIVPPPVTSITATTITGSITVWWSSSDTVWSSEFWDLAGFRLYVNGWEEAREDTLTFGKRKYTMTAESDVIYSVSIRQADMFGNISTPSNTVSIRCK